MHARIVAAERLTLSRPSSAGDGTGSQREKPVTVLHLCLREGDFAGRLNALPANLVSFELFGNTGNDTFNIGNGDVETNVPTGLTLTLHGQGGIDAININDQSNSSPNDWLMNSSGARKNAVGAGPVDSGEIDYDTYETLTLNCNNQGTFVRCDTTAAGVNTSVTSSGTSAALPPPPPPSR